MYTYSKSKNVLPLVVIMMLLTALGCSKDNEVPNFDFTGTYDVIETCDGTNDSYEIIITAVGTDGNTMQIYNLWDWAEYATATVSGKNITIPTQILDEVNFSGNGTISGKILTLNFIAIDDTETENCSAVCEKR